MALIKCKECGKEISSGAGRCPHCGKAHTKRIVKVFGWIIFGFVAVGLLPVICHQAKDDKDTEVVKAKKETANEKPTRELKPFIFRGIKLGAPLHTQIPKCADDWWKGKETGCVRHSHGNSYDIQLLPDIGFSTQTSVDLIDGNIEHIVTYMGDDNADKMLELLKSKYGKPETFSAGVTQNRMGAKFPKFSASWKVEDCHLFLATKLNKIDDGYLFISTEKWIKFEESKEKSGNKKALDNL